MTRTDNPRTLPINLYAADFLTIQPLDFTVLSEAAAVPVPHRETTETLYKLSQIVCVKADSSDTRQLFIMACLQVNVSVGMKMVKAKVQCDGLLQSVYSRSFQSSAVHRRCREIRRWKHHCLCPNLL